MWWESGDTNSDGKVNEEDAPIVEARNELWQILSSSPKSVAFICGDEHNYTRLLIDDKTPVGHKNGFDGQEVTFKYPVWQLVTGGAGAPYYSIKTDLPWSKNLSAYSTQSHYCLFDINPKRVKLKIISLTEQIVDEVELKNNEAN